MVKRSVAASRFRRSLLSLTLLASGMAVALPASPAAAAAKLSFSSSTYGSVPVNQTVDKTIVVTNADSSTAVTISAIAMASGPTSSQFSLVSTGTCLSAALAPLASCQVVYRYAPTGNGGNASGTVTVTATSSATNSFTLSGTGVPLAISSPTPFGTLLLGAASQQLLTLTNIGTANFTLQPTLSTSSAPPWTASLNTCVFGLVLAPGQSCRPSITFSPTTSGHLGSQNTTVSYTSNNATFNVPVSGSGAPPLQVSASTNNFGTVNVGAESTNFVVTIQNVGVTSFTTSGYSQPTSANGFVVSAPASGTTCLTGTLTLAPGASCGFRVKFAPTTGGAATRQFLFSTHGVQFGQLDLSGYGSPWVTVSSTTKDFGNVPVGAVSAPFTVTLLNKEVTSINLTGFTTPATTGPFVVSANTCVASVGVLTLAGSASCSYTVRFQPTSTGPANQQFNYVTNTATFASTTFSGSGVTGLAAAPSTINFVPTEVNSTSLAQNVTVTNNTAFDISVSGGLTSPLPAEWSATLGGLGKCLSDELGAKTLLAGQSCTVSFFFQPNDAADVGAMSQSTTLQLNGQNFVISLNGTGVAPLQANVTSVNFGAVQVGSDSSTQSITLINSSPISSDAFGPLTWSGGTPSNAVYTVTNDCDGHPALDPGETCSVTFQMKPRTSGHLGAQNATVSFTVNGKTFNVSLFGSGVTTSVPTSLDFGSTGINGAAKSKNLVITNPVGSPAITSLSVVKGSISSKFAFGTDGCNGQPLAAGASCNIEITALPTALGALTGTAALTVNGLSYTVDLTATGVNVSFASSVPVGDAGINSDYRSANLVVTNSTSTPLGPLSVTLGAISPKFSFGTNGCAGVTLAASAQCSIEIRYAPTALGASNGTATVTINGTSATVPVSGTGVNVTASASVAFGNWGVGGAAADGTITITNPSSTAAITPITLTTGAISPKFTFGSTTCSGVTLAASGTCTITVHFLPTALGAVTGTAAFTINGQNYSVNLSGTGVTATVLTDVDFGNALKDGAAATATIDITNDTGVPFGPITVTPGAITSGFAFAPLGDQCTGVTLGTTVPTKTCTIALTFSATATGLKSGTAAITINGLSYTVNLSGTGVLPTVPSSLAIGSVGVANTAITKDLVVTNPHDIALDDLVVSVGTPPTGFALVTNGCDGADLGTEVGVDDTCTITFSFTASALGAAGGDVTVTVNGTAHTVALSGTGLGPDVPSSLELDDAGVGGSTVSNTITVTNTTDVAIEVVTFSNGTITGTNPSQFGYGVNTCSGATLTTDDAVPGGGTDTCTITFTFAPTTAGAKSASATVLINGVSYSVALSGTALEVTVPATLSFDDLGVGDGPVSKSITITNATGVAFPALTVTSGSITGTNPTQFGYGTLGCNGTALGTDVGVDDTCTITFTFTPTSAGAKSASATVVVNGVTKTVSLTGTAREVTVPASVTFPDAGLGDTGTTAKITITNATDVSAPPGISLGPLTTTTSALTGPFTVDSSGCSTTLAPGATCDINLTFTPTAVGANNGSVKVTVNGVEHTVTLSGTGKAVSVPASLDFGKVGAGDGTVTASLVVTNATNLPSGPGIALGPLTVSDTSADNGFAFAALGDGCDGETLAAGATCSIDLTFSTSTTGAKSGSGSLKINGQLYSFTLSATGVAVTVPATLSFDPVPVKNGVATADLVVSNDTGTALTGISLGSLTVTDTNADSGFAFAALGDGCTGATLSPTAPGNTCTIGMTFSSTTLGAVTGSATLKINGVSYSVSLSGTTENVTVPTSLDIGNALAGGPKVTKALTIVNPHAYPFDDLEVTVGTPTGDFTYESDTCDGADLTADDSGAGGADECTITFGVLATALGSRTGTASVTVNGIATTVNLSATGVGPTVPATLEMVAGVDDDPYVTPLTITNDTGLSLTLDVTSPSATAGFAFAVGGDDCDGVTLGTSGPSASCTIDLTYVATSTVATTGTATFTLNGVEYSVDLTGTGVTVSVPATLGFGDAGVGDAGKVKALTVTNDTDIPLGPLTIASPTASTGFAFVVGGDDCSGVTLAAGASCDIDMSFSAAALAGATGTASITINTVEYDIDLTGTGVTPSVPSTLGFGSVGVGNAPKKVDLTVTNDSTVGLGPLTVSVGSVSAGFAYVAGDSDCNAATLSTEEPGDTCTLVFSATTAATGAMSGSAVVTINGIESTVNFSGTGVTVAVPASLAFGKVGVGNDPKSASLIVSNLTSVDMDALTVVVDTPSSGFAFDSLSSTCDTVSLVATTGTCELVFTATTAATVALSGSVDVTINGILHAVSFSGTGVTVTVPGSKAVGDVGVGNDPKPFTVTISNGTGVDGVDLVDLDVVVGTPTAGFDIDVLNSTCDGATLATTVGVGDTCVLAFTASTATTGALSGSVLVTIDGIEYTVTFSGTGVTATVPASLAFGDVGVGNDPKSVELTITNTSGVDLVDLDVVVGTPTTGFAFDDLNSSCDGATVAHPSGTCQLTFTASTAATGALSGSVLVTIDGIEHSVTFSGTGVTVTVPGTLAFGQVGVLNPAKSATLTVSNPTGVDLVDLDVVVGTPTTGFTFDSGSSSCDGATVTHPSGTCSLVFTVTTSTIGALSGSVLVTIDGIEHSVTFSGTGVNATSPTSLAFGSVGVGNAPKAVSLTISNSNSVAMVDLDVVVGTSSTGFAYDSLTSTCDGATVAASGTCSLKFTATAAATGALSGSVQVTINGYATTVTFSGTGVTVTVPSTLDFGPSGVNDAARTANLIVRNDSNIALGGLATSVGTPTGPFTVVSNGCEGATLSAANLPSTPGGTCTIQLAFAPPARGAQSGALGMSISGLAHSTTLSGTGVTVTVPSFIEFGLVGQNTTTTRSIQVRNDSAVTLGPLTIGADPPSPGFSLQSQNCSSQTLAPNATCTISYQFSPTTVGDFGGAAGVMINGLPYAVGLHGRSAPPGPTDLTITKVGTTSLSYRWTFGTATSFWVYTDGDGARSPARVLRKGSVYTATRSSLKPGVRYCVSVSADIGILLGGETALSNQRCAVMQVGTVSASAVSSSAVKLKFKGVIGGTYSVVTTSGRQNGFVAVKDGTSVSFQVGGLPANTSACFRVIAVVAGQDSAQSNRVCARTRRSSGIVVTTVPQSGTAPGAPNDLSILKVGYRSINYSWHYPTATSRWTYVDGDGARSAAVVRRRNTTYTATLSSLPPATRRCVSVVGDLGVLLGETPPSNQVCAVLPVGTVTGVTVSADTVELRFAGVVGGSYSIVGPSGRTDGVIGQAAGTSVSVRVGGLPANTASCFRVIAVVAGQDSAPSNLVCVSTSRS